MPPRKSRKPSSILSTNQTTTTINTEDWTTFDKIKMVFQILTFYLIPYGLDYNLDFYNGVNFIMGASSTFAQWSFCGDDYNPLTEGCFGPERVDEKKLTWGVFSILLTFMPGIAFAFIKIFQYLNPQENSEQTSPAKLGLVCIASIFFFPLYVAFVHLQSCYGVYSGGAELSMLLNFGALEVVLESGPQLILQLHTIITGFCPPLIQILSLMSSLFIICKVSVEFHIGEKVFRMKFMEKNIKLLKLLPLFLTCIIFRLGTLTIMVTHINWWVIIPCLVSSVVVTVLAHNHKYGQLSAVSAGPINLFIMGTGINLKQCSGGCWITNTNTKENQIKFYKHSTLFIFIWNTLLLGAFLACWTLVANCETTVSKNTFYQQEWREKVFMREEIRGFGIYAVSGVVVFAGFLNALFLFIDTNEELDNEKDIPESEASSSIK